MKRNSFAIKLLAAIFTFILLGCSSAPKRTMEKTDITDGAYSRLALANTELSKGDFVPAKNDLDFAYNASLSVDNADLLTKVCLTKITLETASSSENKDELNKKCTAYLQEAEEYAARSTNAELYNSICELYKSRILLNDLSNLDKALSICNEIEKNLSNEKQYLAYMYRTRGEIYLAQKKNDLAVEQFLAAAELHTKERYLSEIGLDWYFASRAYSYSNQKQKALDCLQNALKYDRLDENTTGIASDYYGLAVVLLNNNPTDEEKLLAIKYANYSAQIYKAGGFDKYAERSLTLIKKIK